MFTGTTRKLSIPLSLFLILGGCASFNQDAHEVLVRDPKIGSYSPPLPAEYSAKTHWEYAVMSENAYQEGRASVAANRTEFQRTLRYSDVFSKEAFDTACLDESKAIPLRGWQKWDFPSPALQARMLGEGMYLEVLERQDDPHTIVVVFEGTNFSELPDWKANLHWFLRFIPGFKDQYTLTANEVANEFLTAITVKSEKYRTRDVSGKLISAAGKPIKLVATGHSLGGGLAQHFAYAFKQVPQDGQGPKVSEVFAFDSSPVTGWFSTSDPPRSYNANGLLVNRIFEHGEVLAFIRLLTSRLAVSSENPAIWEYRYNFDPETNIVRNHSMRRLACSLANAAQPWLTP
jgi:hypothetical protein